VSEEPAASPPSERTGERATDRTTERIDDRPTDRTSERAIERERARAILDLQEGRGTVQLLGDVGIAELLRSSHRIAVVGASSNQHRPSNGVFWYLKRAGFDAVPVNPNEREVHGVAAFPDLRTALEATGTFDIVDVFRRPEACEPVAEDAVAIGARAIWFQLGVVNWNAARIAAAGGLQVVMDRCTAIEHRRIV
jgi:predicted CoA-binding protein